MSFPNALLSLEKVHVKYVLSSESSMAESEKTFEANHVLLKRIEILMSKKAVDRDTIKTIFVIQQAASFYPCCINST